MEGGRKVEGGEREVKKGGRKVEGGEREVKKGGREEGRGLTLFPCRHIKDGQCNHEHHDRSESAQKMADQTERIFSTSEVKYQLNRQYTN